MAKTYEHALIDWDGTIAKTLDVWLAAYRQILHDDEHQISDDVIGAHFGKPAELMISLNYPNPEVQISRVAEVAIAGLATVDLYPGAQRLLDRTNHLKRALVSSSSRVQINGGLERHHLEPYFGAIITGDMVPRRKPHTDPFEIALAAIGGSPESTIVIGDSESDLIPARQLGIDTILFYPPEHNRFYQLGSLAVHNPTYTVGSLAEAVEIVAPQTAFA